MKEAEYKMKVTFECPSCQNTQVLVVRSLLAESLRFVRSTPQQRMWKKNAMIGFHVAIGTKTLNFAKVFFFFFFFNDKLVA